MNIFNIAVLLVVFVTWIRDACCHDVCNSNGSWNDSSPISGTKFVSEYLTDYDAILPPHQFSNDKPTQVTCDVFIQSFDSVSEELMEYSMTVVMRLQWVDQRLAYTTCINASYIELGPSALSKIWRPDLVILNEKQGYHHDITIPNKSVKIFRNGTVILRERLSLKLSCHMNLKYFPMDTQHCSLEIESFVYELEEISLKWRDHRPVRQDPEIELPRFNIEEAKHTAQCKGSNDHEDGEKFSCLRAEFTLTRHIIFYVVETYIPSVFIVMLSWVSFWIQAESAPARVTLGVTTILTMITQTWVTRGNMPAVSYIRAMDVWIGVCMVFVFAAILEYAVVSVVHRRHCNSSTDKQNGKISDINSENNTEKDKDEVKFKRGRKPMSKIVDLSSRIIFPSLFLIFNIVYWTVYKSIKP